MRDLRLFLLLGLTGAFLLTSCTERTRRNNDDDDDDDGEGGSSSIGTTSTGQIPEPPDGQGGGGGQGGANQGGAGQGGGNGECVGCSEFLTDSSGAELCPQSKPIYDDYTICVCTECAVECSQTCNGGELTSDCQACAIASGQAGEACNGEFLACANDVP
jgi:hypothetical protein